MTVRAIMNRTMLGALLTLTFAQPLHALDGDMNGDGTVTHADYALFHACLQGPGITVTGPSCSPADLHHDLDVDLVDFAFFANAFGTTGAPANNSCANPIAVSDGARSFSTMLATTDGAASSTCNFFGNNQINNDLWFCYTATCTGSAVFSLCGSDFDTKMAVYGGCECPGAGPLACNDDGCGAGVENVQSRITLIVTSGQRYLVRVGGYVGARGAGELTIRCGVDACATGVGDCYVANPDLEPGCGDVTCCESTCNLDTFCCDVVWDSYCAGEASGVCTGNFPACAPTSGGCGSPDGTPGCDDNTCCNRICRRDPFCCLTAWDQNCVDEAQSACFLSCTSRAPSCFTAHNTPGCDLRSCCELICPSDPFCCDTVWDLDCVIQANTVCH